MTGQDSFQKRDTILLVDDAPEDVALLTSLLRETYTIKVAISGPKALEIASSEDPPDLILLDVLMPGVDGYEVCLRLKADANSAEIPIIFLTSKSRMEDEQMGFELGAVDYVTKPISPTIVMARIKTHLELQRQKRDLQDHCEQLQTLEELRDNLVHMIVHDMRGPLTSIMGYLELLADSRSGALGDEEQNLISVARRSTETLNEMISAVLDVSRMESNEMRLNLVECELVDIARELLQKWEPLKRDRQLTLEAPAAAVSLTADPDLLARVIQNLLSNAFKFTPPRGSMAVRIKPNGNLVSVLVQDNGPGIPSEYHEKIFEKFGQVEAREHKQKYSTGLGLTFCKLAVEAHGGRIGLDSAVGRGSTFWFELPVKGPQPGSDSALA